MVLYIIYSVPNMPWTEPLVVQPLFYILKGPSTNIKRTLDFYIGDDCKMVWTKSSLFEYLDPLGMLCLHLRTDPKAPSP